jgi:hypothetical protein
MKTMRPVTNRLHFAGAVQFLVHIQAVFADVSVFPTENPKGPARDQASAQVQKICSGASVQPMRGFLQRTKVKIGTCI